MIVAKLKVVIADRQAVHHLRTVNIFSSILYLDKMSCLNLVLANISGLLLDLTQTRDRW
jgi:hypothetical protein